MKFLKPQTVAEDGHLISSFVGRCFLNYLWWRTSSSFSFFCLLFLLFLKFPIHHRPVPLCGSHHNVAPPTGERTLKLTCALFRETSHWSHAWMLCQLKVSGHSLLISCHKPITLCGRTLRSTVVGPKVQCFLIMICRSFYRKTLFWWKSIFLWMGKDNTE